MSGTQTIPSEFDYYSGATADIHRLLDDHPEGWQTSSTSTINRSLGTSSHAPVNRVDVERALVRHETRATMSATASHSTGPSRAGERVTGMKKWEGRVTEVFDGFFSAILVRLDDTGPEVVADFDFEMLGPDEASMLSAGDTFYVTVRTIRTPSGAKTSTSAVRLRRLGRWSETEIEEITTSARKDAEVFKRLAD
jgi:hypothetical protein